MVKLEIPVDLLYLTEEEMRQFFCSMLTRSLTFDMSS